MIACVALAAACAALAVVHIVQRARIRSLSDQLEEFLAGRASPLEFSVREDSFAPLHNAAAELEKQFLLAREREKEEGRRTSDLTADISHQLKTPLASLRLFCEMDESPHVREQIAQIERMERLIYALLRLERLCADGYEFHFEENSVAGIVREAWGTLEAAWPGRRLVLSGEAELRCDRKWLGEAFVNLLKNACEHTEPGGRIYVTLESTSETVYCAVEDEGGGVSQKDLTHLFERFYRVKGEGESGSGIGLAIVREIIARHHGDIYAENTGRGLRMRISIPVYALARS